MSLMNYMVILYATVSDFENVSVEPHLMVY